MTKLHWGNGTKGEAFAKVDDDDALAVLCVLYGDAALCCAMLAM